MPTYGYVCSNLECGHKFDLVQRMVEDAVKECPACHQLTLEREIGLPFIFIKGEPKTLGHQAARNTEKMGSYEYQEKMENRKGRIRKASEKFIKETKGSNIEHSGELPWWRSGELAGLPKKERPISIKEAGQIATKEGIKIRKPKKKD
jgi:putative FmdB family regulatory protein